MLCEHCARLKDFNLPVESDLVDQIDLKYCHRPPDLLDVRKATNAEYLKLVCGLTNSTSQTRVLKELRPFGPLCYLEEHIPWVKEYHELHSCMNGDQINKLLRQHELLRLTPPVVFKDSEGNFQLDPAEVSRNGSFVPNPLPNQLVWRQQLDYYNPLSRREFERTRRHRYQVLVGYHQVEIDSLELRVVTNL